LHPALAQRAARWPYWENGMETFLGIFGGLLAFVVLSYLIVVRKGR
jgi:hypothetical protein